MKYLVDVNALVALGFSGAILTALDEKVPGSYRIP
jgi:hypothetical protein